LGDVQNGWLSTGGGRWKLDISGFVKIEVVS
jgi:hypothetical protein